jgi:NitT/TauT family transport system substrate-binding protein
MKSPIESRYFVITLVGLLCVFLLSGCSKTQQPVSIAIHMWPGYEPISLAYSLGWLDQSKVRLTETESFTDSITLLEEGKIDAAGLTLDEVLRLREKGVALSVVLVCDVSAGADMLLVRPDIKSLAGIKGRRIAVEEGALGALMLYQVLKAAGLKKEDVKIVSVSVDRQADAWKRGEIDAAISFEPGSSQLQALGGKPLFDSRQIPELIFDVIAVRTSILDDAHENAIRHLVETHLKGLQYINRNPDDASYRMAPRFKLPPDQVMETFKGLVLPDLQNNIRLMRSDKPAILNSALVVGDVMLKAGILHQPLKMKDLLHAEYLPAIE